MSFVYFICTDKIGHHDPELGRKLTGSFFTNLLTAEQKPSHLILVEKGVHLLLPSFSTVDALKILEKEMKVEILACGTCLDYYQVKDQIVAGRVSNMAEIIDVMHAAEKVIRI